MNEERQKEIIACHHENGTVNKVKLNTGNIITIEEAIKIAKENKLTNFTASYDNRSKKEVLRGRRETVPNGRLYDLPRF